MASFLILAPASGPGKDHRETRFIRDGFSLTAFFLPGLWLLWQQFWVLGVAALVLQGGGIALIQMPALWPAGFALLLGVSLLVALEGRNLMAGHLVSAGWRARGLISAKRLAEAEEIYFNDLPDDVVPPRPAQPRDIPGRNHGNTGGASLGLIGYDGGR